MRKLRLLTVAMLALVFAAAIAQAQSYTVLYNFGGPGSPNTPVFSGIIAQSYGGNLFSTAPDEFGIAGPGSAFKITPAGALTLLHSFNFTDGAQTHSGLTLGTDGYYYGTAERGGLHDCGTVFKMTWAGDLITLHNFTCGADGGYPGAPPIQGFDGNLYGTTGVGGSVGNTGTVYKVTSSGAFTTLHTFGFTRDTDLGTFNGPLVQGTDGYLYGTTLWGGTHGLGTIFRIGYSGKFTTLFNFDDTHGSNPHGALIQASDGNFYGAASNGGSNGAGVVFRITPTGTFTVLYNFNGSSDGSYDTGGLVQATDGNLYGTNVNGGTGGFQAGVLFRITLAGTFTVLHNFLYAFGASPYGAILQHTNGLLYGTAAIGGQGGGGGTFYSFDVGLRPSVRCLPEARIVGQRINILGQGFTGTTAVSFNGTPAAFTVISDTYLAATVPHSATTGPITVTTPGGTLESNKKFQVRPYVASFSPASGPVGTTVIIKGDGLKPATQVAFGGVAATSFTVDSNSQVTAVVPSGAKTGGVSITTSGAPTYSAATFTVTP